MLIDLTVCVTPALEQSAASQLSRSLVGHIGTHFDVMHQTFPLAYTKRKGIVFDISGIRQRDIEIADIDLSAVESDMFVAFYSGWIEEAGYGSTAYFQWHPQLSHALIDALLAKNISILGVDFGGIRRGKEHTPADQKCAEHNVFVVENLCALKEILQRGGRFTAHTYPLRYQGVTGLPCRVVGEIAEEGRRL